jgi:hypothetical protein
MTPYAGAPLDREHRLIERPEFRDTHDNWHRGADVTLPQTELTIADVARFQRWAMFRYFVRPRMLARMVRGRYITLQRLIGGGALLVGQGTVAGLNGLFQKLFGARHDRVKNPV